MADTGWVVPSVSVNSVWTNPGNVFASDDARAVAATAGDSQVYDGFNLDSIIPAGATILGFEVKVEAHGASGGETLAISLSPNGSSWASKSNTFQVTTDEEKIYGASNDLWIWFDGSYSQIAEGNFHLRGITPNGGQTVNIDYIAVKVYYLLPPSLEQEGFRWRNDDGSESAASWAAAQEAQLTRAKETAARLRVLVNATNDPDSQQFRLEVRKKGTSDDWQVIA